MGELNVFHRLVGKGRALQLILSGEIISAQEAYRIGLVNEVVPAASLLSRAEGILNQFISNAPVGVKVLHRGSEQGIGYEPCGGATPRSFAVRDLRGDRKTKKKEHPPSCKACSKVSGDARAERASTRWNSWRETEKRKTHGGRKHFFRIESRGPR